MAPQHPPVSSPKEGGSILAALRRQWPVILVAAVAVLAAFGLLARSGIFQPAPPPSLVGGPFSLVDQDNRPVTEAALKGKWNVVFFGFTYCPDVCPATLQALAQASDLMGPKAKDLRIVFISVDPGRDTPAAMKAYAQANQLPAGSLALTGTPAQVAAVTKVYRVYYEKVGDGPGYTVNHSSAAYLMDPKGRFSRVVAYGQTPEQMADQIKSAMRGD